MLDESTQKPGTNIKKRAINACESMGFVGLAKRLGACGDGARCGSYWCPECRNAIARITAARIERYVTSQFPEYEQAKQRLRWVTILVAVVPWDGVRKALDDGRALLKAMRRGRPDFWIVGAFELELIDLGRLFRHGAEKKQTVLEMTRSWVTPFERDYLENGTAEREAINVHLHVLMDLGDESEDTWRRRLERRGFRFHRQLRFDRLHEKQTMHDMARKLGSYPFKDRVRFNVMDRTEGYQTGSYFTNSQLARLVMLHDDIGHRSLMIFTNERETKVSIKETLPFRKANKNRFESLIT